MVKIETITKATSKKATIPIPLGILRKYDAIIPPKTATIFSTIDHRIICLVVRATIFITFGARTINAVTNNTHSILILIPIARDNSKI